MIEPARKKTFDCLSSKQAVQSEIFEEIKNMTHEEQMEYFSHAAKDGSLGTWWKSLPHPDAPSAETDPLPAASEQA